MTMMDTSVLGHDHKDGAGTEIARQYSIPDSVQPTTSGECVYAACCKPISQSIDVMCSYLNCIPSEPHPVHQEVQQAETGVAEERISHGQSENFSDSDDYLTPPSSQTPLGMVVRCRKHKI